MEAVQGHPFPRRKASRDASSVHGKYECEYNVRCL